jgi:hypothetical protein
VVTRCRRVEVHLTDQQTDPQVSRQGPDLPLHQSHPQNLLQEQDQATARITVPEDKH